MLFPKKRKYKKAFKGTFPTNTEKATRGVKLHFGECGLKAISSGSLTSQQLEAARRAIVRKIKRAGKVWICVFPDIPVTAKPTEVRMGKGKGNVSHWIVKVRQERILFEMAGVSVDLARAAFQLGAAKLPIQTAFLTKIVEEGAQ